MDHADEPQKKIFKARKTMKVSDRQQLEVVYKIKEDFKLVNGKHENGDSDISYLSETDCMEDQSELTGMQDFCVDLNNVGPKGVTVTSLSDTMENRSGTLDTDFNLTIDPLPTDEVNYKNDIMNVLSSKTDGPMLETNEEVNFTTNSSTTARKCDQMNPLGCLVAGRELCCGEDYVEETVVERGSDKTISLLSEEIVLEKHPEESVVLERQLGEKLVKEDLVMVEAVPDNCSNEQQGHLNELPLEKPHPVVKVNDPQLPEMGATQQQEFLEDLPSGVLAIEPQKNAARLMKPELDIMEQIEMTVEREETNLEAQPTMETVQEVAQQSIAETRAMFIPQPSCVLPLVSKEEVKLIDQNSEQELTEDQLLEDLAEEQQFGEELGENILLDELIDQPPENVLSSSVEANLVVGQQKTSEERDLDVEVTKQKPLETLENADVMTVLEEKNSQTSNECESVCAEVAETQESKQLLEQQDAIDDIPQKEQGEHGQFEPSAEMECNWDEGEKAEEMDEGKILHENTLLEDAGEGAISSSMEMHQASLVPDTALPKPLMDLQNSGCELEKSECMETDDIIPILEKLAPVEDVLRSFSKPPVLSEVDQSPELDKADSQSSLSKPEHSENLPAEAFLVLSDEEDSCVEEVLPSAVPLSQPSNTETKAVELSEKQLNVNDEPKTDMSQPERSETTRRKRSKSEDLDSAQFKRRRYEGEEYEAELQVKIMTRADVDQKLQKVIQRLLEEKLSALQCAVFDKTLADLKSRVEKIECKKHESVLNGIQAKIARLSKRFGAAKEDLKKRQETQSVQPVQPSQPESPIKAASDGTNSLVQRNVGSVRHMLESKRAGDMPASSFQAPANAGPPTLLTQPPPLQAAPNQAFPRIAPAPSSQSPITVTTPARQMQDWKLIQQRINTTHLAPPQPKSQTPVTSTQMMTPVLSSNTTATVVESSQVSSGSSGPLPVSLQSLQSLPVILRVPVMQSTLQNTTLMQSTTGTLVTNQHSGNIEFIPAQNQGNVGTLKTPGCLAPSITTKQNNALSLPSPTIQRNSPASASSGPTLSLHAVSVAHTVAQAVRTSLPTVSTAGQYTTTNSRASLQMKVQSASFSSPPSAEPLATSRTDIQINRTPMSEAIVAKRAAESTTQGGKPGAGVIDLTLDDDEANSSQDGRKTNPMSLSGINQPPPILPRPPQLPQTALVQQNAMSSGMPTQTTIHVLPAAQTTVNVNHRPMAQSMPRLSGPRTPTNHQVVYTTLPSTPIQSPVRNASMHGQIQGLRQISPQTGGVTVRMPQTTTYLVNNGMTVGSGGPQLTVHHRPPQVRSEPVRTIHPAPLPEAPQPQRLPPEAANTSLPQKPHLKLARVQSQNGIVLSWSVLEVDRSCASVDSYHLYAYHEDPTASTPSQWKKIGEVKALPLPMACTLTQFVSGSKYYFAVRAKDVYGRFGVFCDPQSTDVIATQNS